MSRRSLVLFLIAGLTVVGHVGEGLAACECIVGSEYYPTGTRIVVWTNVWVTIDGSKPSFVRHGWAFGSSCGGTITDAEAICAFGQEHMRFELRLDGQLVRPTIFNSFECPPNPEGWDCPAEKERSHWPAVWFFEFPAGYFTPGNHTLEGTWSIVEHPLACRECVDEMIADMEEEGGWIVTQASYGINSLFQYAVTLTVLYPP
jgi:hypothetical protein